MLFLKATIYEKKNVIIVLKRNKMIHYLLNLVIINLKNYFSMYLLFFY